MRQTITNWFQRSGLQLFPLYKTLRVYSLSKAFCDFRAAVNVSLLDFTQGMAYALIAGLPVQTGIFGSALSSVTGPAQASSRFIMLGPTNATAVMLLSTFLTLGYAPEQAVLALPVLLFMVGLFMIGGAFIRIASITQYISRAVVVGYITAAACLIIVNQMKNVLGLEVPRAGTFAESFQNLIIGASTFQWESLLVAAITLIIYLPLKQYAKGLPTVAFALVAVGGITYALGRYGIFTEMLDPIRISTWRITLPSATFAELATLANAALAVAFLSLLESSSISKTLAAQAGDRIDLNQQMLSIGTANMVCAFGGGMAVSGSLTRSVLNFKSGAKTAVSSIFSGLLLILGLFLEQMRNMVEHPDLKIIILRLRNAHNLDASVALTIKDLVIFARKQDRDVIVSGAHPSIERVFRNSGLLDTLTEANFFRYHPENPTISTRDALKRAQEITGSTSADIKIYASDEKKKDS